MKICLYSDAFWPSLGGLETAGELLAGYLAEKGHKVTVVTQTPASDRDAAPYMVVRRPDREKLRQVAAEHDLVHSNGMSVRAVLAAARGRVPVVVTHQTFNAAVPRTAGELRRMVEQEGVRRLAHALASAFTMHLARANVCISQFLRERLKPPRGLVIYNPIHRRFRPLAGVDRTNRFAFVGRLVSDKGCEVLLQALAGCAQRGYLFGLDIYGEGPEKENLNALAHKCGLSEQVSFHGKVRGEALVQAYNRSLAVVVPSVWEEPLGIVALEAMACGRVVIASAAGGLGEVVEGVGLTFVRGDSRALANCLVRASEDWALRKQLAHRGELFVRSFFIDTIGEEYIELYRTVLQQPAARAKRARRGEAFA